MAEDANQEPRQSMEWEPVVRLGTFSPLWMRIRGKDGRWVYREPTEDEVQKYIENEAW